MTKAGGLRWRRGVEAPAGVAWVEAPELGVAEPGSGVLGWSSGGGVGARGGGDGLWGTRVEALELGVATR
ncbi:hypothetical protein E2562_013405 [Oryza meyeriana var. granulata]|uniref:DUF834 domain-containing protein n=1 Tax=Oryza meyeriana var. granulata TaxID=110450 RepID=A0A6G1EAA2_9ORYZ|nr:hypothetical protein E2562_013405 [Oryza meyeriana var. granulata]